MDVNIEKNALRNDLMISFIGPTMNLFVRNLTITTVQQIKSNFLGFFPVPFRGSFARGHTISILFQ